MFFIWIIIGLCHLWSAAAIYYCVFPKFPVFSAACAIAYLCLIVPFCRTRPRNLFLSLLGFLMVLLYFNFLPVPANAHYPDYLQMPYAELHGDTLVFHKVRNNVYRTRDDFDVHYETRNYDLKGLQTLDLLVNYWGLPWLAHTFLAFGFSDGRFLDVSVEIRPPSWDKYDMVKGYFKRYQLIYIWGDEHDLVGKRVIYQGEDIYLYHIKATPEVIRKLFDQMVKRTNQLDQHPQFYNTTTQNCASTIDDDAADAGVYVIPLWRRWMLTGDIDQRLYREGILETQGLPFEQLRQRSKINDRARMAGQDIDFSRKIRTP